MGALQRRTAGHPLLAVMCCRLNPSWLCGGVVLLALAGAAAAQNDDDFEFFERKIRPVLVQQCYVCHSAKASVVQGGLLVDTREGLRKGGSSGRPAVVPKDPAASRLLTAIKQESNLKMPPGAPLPAEVITDFEDWIRMGAPDPREGSAGPAPSPYNFEEAHKFWSFQPIRDPQPPRVQDPLWGKTAIDRFVKAKLDEKKLTPLGLASKRVLIRRATYDLTGVPPTAQQIDAFLQDASPNAFERLVDRLLASQQYGERWARHWLDVVRYADTSGCNSDFPIPDMYRYRNWVIRAFNEDKPYDQFLREQIAGDILAEELSEKNLEERQARIIATGYLANSRRFGSRKNEFHLTIEDTIDNLGKAMLGLSVACARCHDHKFDPIPNRDYYALYGIFQSTRYAFPGTEVFQSPRDLTPLGDVKEAARLRQYQEEASKLEEQKEDLVAGRASKGLSREERRKQQSALADRLALLETRFPDVPKAYAVTEGTPSDAQIHRTGNPRSLGDDVPRGWLTILGGRGLPPGEKGSGRRQLAEWVTDPSNPLAARVMVNRIWQHHFGKGIVQTPNDFGARGGRPTHPELLDYLASRFRESGYSLKAMHKLIMLTRVYRLASGHDPNNAVADPRNDHLWRFDRRRLDAEEIRDSMLAVAGTLDRTMGGRHPFPPDTKIKYSQHRPYIAGPEVFETKRRGIYLVQQRIKKQPFLATFDGADTNASTAKRTPSVTALQALALMNSSFVHERSDEMAVRVGMAHSTAAARIHYAFRLALARPATPAEIQQGVRHLAAARRAYRDAGTPAEEAPRAALASYMRVLLASNEFLYVD